MQTVSRCNAVSVAFIIPAPFSALSSQQLQRVQSWSPGIFTESLRSGKHLTCCQPVPVEGMGSRHRASPAVRARSAAITGGPSARAVDAVVWTLNAGIIPLRWLDPVFPSAPLMPIPLHRSLTSNLLVPGAPLARAAAAAVIPPRPQPVLPPLADKLSPSFLGLLSAFTSTPQSPLCQDSVPAMQLSMTSNWTPLQSFSLTCATWRWSRNFSTNTTPLARLRWCQAHSFCLLSLPFVRVFHFIFWTT